MSIGLFRCKIKEKGAGEKLKRTVDTIGAVLYERLKKTLI